MMLETGAFLTRDIDKSWQLIALSVQASTMTKKNLEEIVRMNQGEC